MELSGPASFETVSSRHQLHHACARCGFRGTFLTACPRCGAPVAAKAKKPPRLRLTGEPPERDDHLAFVHFLDRFLEAPAEWTAMNMGHVKLRPDQAVEVHRRGCRSGWPDFLLCHGLVYGLELKTTDGALSRTHCVRTRRGQLRVVVGQVEMHERLRAAGMQIAVCQGFGPAVVQVARWRMPLRSGWQTALMSGEVG